MNIPYPRVCAHRGLSALLPENSLASLEAAADAGAQEIEFDLRVRDDTIILRHDPIALTGLGRAAPPAAFEDVLERLAGRVIMNIHIKVPEAVPGAVEIIERYGCRDSVYIAGGGPVMKAALAIAPDIARCCLEGHMNFTIVRHALKYKAQKVQFFKPFFNQGMVDEAHQHGLLCNVYYSDDPEEARQLFRMGMDTVLTNNCIKILPSLNTL